MSLSGEQHTQKGESLIQGKRSDSPEPSCVSMNSDWSMDHPYQFREGENPTEFSLIQGKRSDSPEPSCVSMKSDWSMDRPIFFRKGENRTEFSAAQISSRQSHRNFRADEVSRVFSVVLKKINLFMKKELKRFSKHLMKEDRESSEKMRNDLLSARVGALNVTLHFLKKMGQNNMADALEMNELVLIRQCELKSNLRRKYHRVFEGTAKQGEFTSLNKIYTELYITEGGRGEVNREHEVRHIEMTSRRAEIPETPINCCDLFKQSSGQDRHIRTVLTKGVAGIGKSVSVQKFILDWADGRINQDIKFIFPLPFRELNLKEGKHSLMDILNQYFPETCGLTLSEKYKVLFIFDGLDECRLPLNFLNNETWCDATKKTSLDILLTNLIKGNLLPSALIWITTRPAAASRISPECVDQVSEVRGFNDSQKEEYFRKRFSDEKLADRIISHIKESRSLHIMCHIPVFCWISATVLENIVKEKGGENTPKTLTQMYMHFLIFQTIQKKRKYDGDCGMDDLWDKEGILSLGKLAFHQLEKSNLIFYGEDLKECGINLTDASIYSGVCTQIFRAASEWESTRKPRSGAAFFSSEEQGLSSADTGTFRVHYTGGRI